MSYKKELMKEPRIYYWVIVAYVIVFYCFFPTFHLSMTSEPDSLYQHLTQGFLAGHLYLDVSPSPELLTLANPYNPLQNVPYRLHDASLYQGKYYLYFGPLPVLIFYLPFKVITGLYPSDALTAFFFLLLAFLVGFYLMIKIKEQYFSSISHWYLILTGLLLGFGNGITILFSLPRVYEVAISSALCFMIFSFYFLYQFFHQNKTKDLFLFSLCLALTVAARAYFAIVCILLILALFIYLIRNLKNRRLILLSALLIPPCCIALLLGGYNYLRFASVLDFGHSWQLSCIDIIALHDRLIDLTKIRRNLWFSFYFYFLQPFTLSLKFPYFGPLLHNCLYFIDKDYYLEEVAGVLTTTPLLIFLLALPKVLLVYFQEKSKRPLVWFVLLASFVPIINVLFLLALPFVTQRYVVDFLPYWLMLAVISFWMLEGHWGHFRWFRIVKLFFISSAIMSIVLGLCFTLTYWVFL